jgi:thiol-disulfide isomerase/thioredoxin
MNSSKPFALPLGSLVVAALLALAPLAAEGQSLSRTALAFKAVDTEGKAVSFPADYKGHLVLLDFWATWCPPCVEEVPGLVRAFEKYKAQGLEILGVSLDQADSLERVNSFTKANKMPWRQIYDGKYWRARIAQFYKIDSIPRSFLVDGDSGEILATGDILRGEALDHTLARAIAARK